MPSLTLKCDDGVALVQLDVSRAIWACLGKAEFGQVAQAKRKVTGDI